MFVKLFLLISNRNSNAKPVFEENFYNSLKSFYELLAELIVKYGVVPGSSNANASINMNGSSALAVPTSATPETRSRESDLASSFKSCNRSLAMFVKKSLNILNRQFLFRLINRYLESFHLCDKQMLQIKFDFIRIVCNHEHFVAFSLPIRKAVSNINEFAGGWMF